VLQRDAWLPFLKEGMRVIMGAENWTGQ
jgi:hypothetical protein